MNGKEEASERARCDVEGGMEGQNYIPERRFRKFHTIFYAPTQLQLTSSCTFYYYYLSELKVDALNLYSK